MNQNLRIVIAVLIAVVLTFFVMQGYYNHRYQLPLAEKVCKASGFDKLGDVYFIGGSGINEDGSFPNLSTVRQLGLTCIKNGQSYGELQNGSN